VNECIRGVVVSCIWAGSGERLSAANTPQRLPPDDSYVSIFVSGREGSVYAAHVLLKSSSLSRCVRARSLYGWWQVSPIYNRVQHSGTPSHGWAADHHVFEGRGDTRTANWATNRSTSPHSSSPPPVLLPRNGTVVQGVYLPTTPYSVCI
jgi:hypothetical protein